MGNLEDKLTEYGAYLLNTPEKTQHLVPVGDGTSKLVNHFSTRKGSFDDFVKWLAKQELKRKKKTQSHPKRKA